LPLLDVVGADGIAELGVLLSEPYKWPPKEWRGIFGLVKWVSKLADESPQSGFDLRDSRGVRHCSLIDELLKYWQALLELIRGS
jgi:hypothetical protein